MSRDLCPTGVKGTKPSHTWKSPRVLERCFLDSRCCLLPSIQCPIPGPLPLSPTPPSQQGHPTPILKLWASWDDFPNQEEDGDFEVRVDGVSCLSPTIPYSSCFSTAGYRACKLYFPAWLSTWLLVRCRQGETLAGVRKKLYFCRLGCASAESGQPWKGRRQWLRAGSGSWFSAN